MCASSYNVMVIALEYTIVNQSWVVWQGDNQVVLYTLCHIIACQMQARASLHVGSFAQCTTLITLHNMIESADNTP